MYYYIYDAYLSDRKHQRTLARIETRLTDLGINGKINYLSYLKNIGQIIRDEAKQGVTTIVVVGNDRTIGQTLNILPNFNVTIGIIPIGPQNQLAKLLAIPDAEDACETLSSRIVDNLDVGIINNYYFLGQASIAHAPVTIECDNNYFVSINDRDHTIRINNLAADGTGVSQPTDGLFEIVMESRTKSLWRSATTSMSRLHNNSLTITSEKPIQIMLHDEHKIIKTPATASIRPQALKVIVGKHRQYATTTPKK